MYEKEDRNGELEEETEFSSVDSDEFVESEDYYDFEEELPERELSSISRLINTFVDPVSTMKDIIAKPTLLFPIIVVIIATTISSVLTMGLAKEAQIQAFADFGISVTQQMIDGINWQVQAGVAASGILIVLFSFVIGLIVHGISLLMGGKAKLKNTFSVYFHASYISSAGLLILSTIKYFTNDRFITFSPAMFLAEDMLATPIFVVLASLDVFSIWSFVVTVIGISITHKISKIKAVIPILFPTVVIVAILAYFASFTVGII
ncbi:MAG: YIP1 family protein [Clostridiales bacterium]|nr:YIP1 family protein [Clostridiales bacterium]